jgi:hypothetical protein
MEASVNYNLMDMMIEDEDPYQEIARVCHCAPQTVSARARKIGIKKKNQRGKYDDANDNPPFIPPEKRLEMAMQAKIEALSLPDWYPIDKWINGQGGRQFMMDGGY